MYSFASMPTFGTSSPFETWENGFTDEEIAQIVALGESKIPEKAAIMGRSPTEEYEEVRRSRTSWIGFEDAPWLFDKLGYIARQLNGEFFGFDLDGFAEPFQYTIYDGKEEGHYDWHQDQCPTNSGRDTPRKLSMIVQLSDSNEYVGGNIELMTARDTVFVKRTKGLVAAFPSFNLHRVAPVTSGVRKSLVVWITGPAFK